jgi:hypothetical protein
MGNKKEKEKDSYLAVLVHAGVKSAADAVLSFEELDLDGLIAEEMVRREEILEGHQARRAGTDDCDLLHGAACWMLKRSSGDGGRSKMRKDGSR